MAKPIFMGMIFMAITAWAGSSAEAVDLGGVDIHGFISQGYLVSDDNNYLADSEDGSLQFNEVGVNFSKQLTDNLRMGLQLFSRDLGKVGNNGLEIDWAYGDYRWRDWFGVRVGLMKMAHGLYNETRDIDMLRTSILLPQSVYIETTRDYYTRMWGLELYGEIPLNRFGSLSYRALVGTYTPDEEDSGLRRIIEDQGPFEVKDFDNGVQYNGSLQWHTPLDGLRLGITSWKQHDFQSTIENRAPLGPTIPAGRSWEAESDNETTVYSAEYLWNELTLAVEYQHRKTASSVKDILPKEERRSEGYYAGAAYRFADWFEAGAYYSASYSDKDDKDGDRYQLLGQPRHRSWQKDFALSLRFDVNDYWVVKLEGHRMDGTDDLYVSDNADGLEEDWFLFAAKATFSF